MSDGLESGAEIPRLERRLQLVESPKLTDSIENKQTSTNQPDIFQPLDGTVAFSSPKFLRHGEIERGVYTTARASHRFGIYIPNSYEPNGNYPVILMTTPLGTGMRGHNQNVAEDMMNAGFVVIKKGPPRYHGPTLSALSYTEDSNEMLGLMKAIDEIGILGSSDELFVYGESQAAPKALGVMGLADSYGKSVTDGLVVAPCYLKRINYLRPHRQIKRLGGMAAGITRFITQSTAEQRTTLKGTVSHKDLHHHVIVIPVLISGEPWDLLDHIDSDQKFTEQLFGKDGHSHPGPSKTEMQSRFQNADVRIDEKYGHVDGIMSHELRVLRGAMLYEIAKKLDMPAPTNA